MSNVGSVPFPLIPLKSPLSPLSLSYHPQLCLPPSPQYVLRLRLRSSSDQRLSYVQGLQA